MAVSNRLRPIGEDEVVPDLITAPQPRQAPPERAQQGTAVMTTMLLMALKALSQRFVVALAALFDLGLCASVFFLWLQVIEQPTVFQLTGVGIYAIFALIVVWMRREM
jgi:hypothetical protein